MATSDLQICAPLFGGTQEEVFQSMHIAKEEGATLAELKIDSSQIANEVESIIKQRILPLIITFRLNPSGGPSEKKKCFEVLELALDLGAEYVDLDLEVAAEFIQSAPSRKRCSSKVIVSCHVSGGTPSKEELGNLVARLQSTGADVVKVVTDATNITDIARIFHLHSHSQVPLIACATGDRGLISQLLCPKFGGFLVYGSTVGNLIPGVPPLASLSQVYKLENVNADTKVFGLIANPVGHSKGPILHNPSLRHAGYNGIYVPLLVDDINEFFRVYSSPDFAGFSVGIPHKEAAVGCCDEVHPLAKSIGAVNTIVRRPSDGRLVGYNTDCEAAITAMEDALRARKGTSGEASNISPLAGKLFVLVGAGGAGRALAFGAKSRGARIVIFNRNNERAKALAHAVAGEARPYEEKDSFCPEKGMILANATAVGMQPNSGQTPVAKEALGAYDLVFDSVYTPRNTRLLKEAEEAGAIAVSGVEMFIRQAIGQFNLFTGGEAPEEFMRKIVLTKF
ncbi:bifunctional 3-dehydroquinate dehydratase/shikimate dehydrogenase, chloroplastic-like isoform X2 [Magnolia sinica]|uniref:bifunctional 3-dehydroquinate dehydratase/shikimate dehydrogenase, chloroplastic-like isoform X2 n=1 Tax=Magnolia sinica TaxID=86752 RepID=UPI00265A5149|nr:bifunctional 3-dehydroquinate dehydratase/shikimate dehydrogenase, chloroplastic-like isoform X2 [Magnolia sinica]